MNLAKRSSRRRPALRRLAPGVAESAATSGLAAKHGKFADPPQAESDADALQKKIISIFPNKLHCSQHVRPRVDSFFEYVPAPKPTSKNREKYRAVLSRLILPTRGWVCSYGCTPRYEWRRNQPFDLRRLSRHLPAYVPTHSLQIRCPILAPRYVNRETRKAEYRLKK